MTVLPVVIAILLPPAAVLAQRGASWAFWLNLLLTLCFFVPGVAHALWVVLWRADTSTG